MHSELQGASTQGFSLIELMVTLAVVGILAGVAYPAYTEYVLRSHRVHAQALLQQAAHWMERTATAIGHYPKQSEQADALNALQTQLSNPRYTITVASTDGLEFLVSAAPQTAQRQDRCGTLTFSHTAERGITALPPQSTMTAALCWNR